MAGGWREDRGDQVQALNVLSRARPAQKAEARPLQARCLSTSKDQLGLLKPPDTPNPRKKDLRLLQR